MIRASIRVLIRLAIVLVVLAFLVYVWPTRWRYDHVSVDGNTYPVRMDRINGDSDMLVPDQGWVPVEGDSGENGPESNQPTAARATP
jgi:hypothetical protein